MEHSSTKSHTFALVVGDGSGDGHNSREEHMFRSNLSAQDVATLYKKRC